MIRIQNFSVNNYSQQQPQTSPSFKGRTIKKAFSQSAKPVTKKLSKVAIFAGTTIGAVTKFFTTKLNKPKEISKKTQETDFLVRFMEDMANRPFEDFSQTDKEVFDKCFERYKELNK